jgi:P4 family phage/plasmid primase-like protien
MAELVVKLNRIGKTLAEKGHVIYVPAWERYLVFRGGIYKEIDEETLRSRIRQRLPDALNKNRNVNEIISFIRDNYAHTPKEFDTGDFINCKNGLVNRKTLELKKHDPAYLSLRQIGTEFDADAICPYIEELFRTWTERDFMKLAEIVAWCLINGYDLQSFISLLGPGNNGKTTYLKLLTDFLGGMDNVSSISMAELADDKFKGSEMFGKMANVSGEGAGTHIKEEMRILSLTGGDPVSWERKYGHPWSAVNVTKQVFASNWLTRVKQLTKAWIRRFEPILFLHDFTVEDKEHPRQLQSTILKKAAREFPGLLNWALRLMPEMEARQGWSTTYSEDEKREMYKLFSDPIHMFLAHFERDDGSWVPKIDLWQSFLNECTKHEMPTGDLGEYSFYKALQGAAPWVHDYRPDMGEGKSGPRCFIGLRSKPDRCLQLFQLLFLLLQIPRDIESTEKIEKKVDRVGGDIIAEIAKARAGTQPWPEAVAKEYIRLTVMGRDNGAPLPIPGELAKETGQSPLEVQTWMTEFAKKGALNPPEGQSL